MDPRSGGSKGGPTQKKWEPEGWGPEGISSKGFDSSICDWKNKFPFSLGNITSSLFE